jgi:hypothetical protein
MLSTSPGSACAGSVTSSPDVAVSFVRVARNGVALVLIER